MAGPGASPPGGMCLGTPGFGADSGSAASGPSKETLLVCLGLLELVSPSRRKINCCAGAAETETGGCSGGSALAAGKFGCRTGVRGGGLRLRLSTLDALFDATEHGDSCRRRPSDGASEASLLENLFGGSVPTCSLQSCLKRRSHSATTGPHWAIYVPSGWISWL